MKLTILIPVYNEEATVEELLRRVRAVPLEKEILVCDDGSTDGTARILSQVEAATGVRIFRHEVNRGKGAALRTLIPKATGDVVMIQDADLEYNPQEYEQLLAPIRERKTNVVYGSRFLGSGRAMFFWHALGNKFLTLLTNMLYDSTLSDMETCYKVFRRELLQSLSLRARRFDIEPEITAQILKRGERIWEVPITYAGREYSEGKKITWKDGVIAVLVLIRIKFSL